MIKPDLFKLPPKIKAVAGLIAEVTGTAIDAYAREQITDEPSTTDRWVELSKLPPLWPRLVMVGE